MATPKKNCYFCAQQWPDQSVEIKTNCETKVLYFCGWSCKDVAMQKVFEFAKENAKIFESVVFKKVNYPKVKFK